jgi:hypothetical protein
MRFMRPRAVPVVRLEAGSFRSKQYRDNKCPRFTVTGWVDGNGRPYPAIGTPQAAPSAKELLDDDIPF